MVNDNRLKEIVENGWGMSSETWRDLDDYHKSFFYLELGSSKNLNFYVDRLQAINFKSFKSVLDAGCGIGQWSKALAQLNQKVTGMDLMASRVKWAKTLHSDSNLNFEEGNLVGLRYSDESFDAVFCYGVFMFADYEKVLSEFNRVLRPGGQLYLNVNSWGWYLHLLLKKGMVRQVSHFLKNTLLQRNSNIVYSRDKIYSELLNHGFQVNALSHEGGIGDSRPIYPRSTLGITNILEVVARKA